MAARRFTDEQEQTIAQKYLSGRSARNLAREYGTDGKVITTALKRQGVSVHNRKTGGKDTYKNETWLRQKYEVEQLSAEQIGQLVDRSRATVQNWMETFEIGPRESGEAAWIARRMNYEPNDTYQNEAWLREHYVEQGMTIIEVGELAGCSEATVYNWLLRFGIPIRSRGEAMRTGWQLGGVHYERVHGDTPKLYRNREWLRVQYEDKRLSLTQIAEATKYDRMSIYRWMKRHSIPRRTNAGYVEPQIYHNADWLRQKYWEEELSTAQIAEIAGCHRVNVRMWMLKYDIPLRNKSESVKLAWDQEILGSEETRRKLSENRKAAWARGDYDGTMFNSPTSIEIALAQALDDLELDHESQYRPDGCRFIYDEYVYPNILIEANGDYWHSEKARPGITERDAEKARWASDNGFYEVVMWEHEINKIGSYKLINERVLPLL